MTLVAILRPCQTLPAYPTTARRRWRYRSGAEQKASLRFARVPAYQLGRRQLRRLVF